MLVIISRQIKVFRQLLLKRIQKTSLSCFTVDSIKREDYDSDEQYKTKLNAQKAYLDNLSKRGILLKKTVKSLYQYDKKSKTFKKKGR